MYMTRRRRGAVLLAVAALAGARAACAGIAFDSTSWITLTHDADISNPADVPFSTGPISVPKSINLYPVNPYQIDNTFSSGTANTIAAGSLGQVTNATTGSFVLATICRTAARRSLPAPIFFATSYRSQKVV